jgi:multimeric flavodoxin WrbA
VECIQITRDRRRRRKTIRKIIQKDLKVNELDRDMIYDRVLWRHLILVADPTYWGKAWLLYKNASS